MNGAAFYSLMSGRVGAAAAYGHQSFDGAKIDAESGGVFGDWYVSDVVTLSARAGLTGGTLDIGGPNISLKNSNYVGGQLVGYPCPNLALTGTVENIHLGLSAGGASETITQANYGVGAEYLISTTTPLSVSVGYTDTNISAGGTTLVLNTYSVGLKYYFGAGSSLKDHQRSGTEVWSAGSPITGLLLAVF